MNETSRRILDHFQVRKTKKQKEEFRKYIIHELNQYGYCPSIQHKGINNNIIIGNIEKAKIFCTAHYDTQAVLPFPNLIVPNNLFGLILSQLAIIIYIEIIYVFLTIFLYLLKCPQSLILSALRAFCFCGKPHISRSIFLYFRYQSWLKSW